MISRPVFSSSPKPKSATSKRARSSGVITIPAPFKYSAARATAASYCFAAIIGDLSFRTADLDQALNLAFHGFPARRHHVFRPADSEKLVRTERHVIFRQALAHSLEIRLLQNRTKIDLRHAEPGHLPNAPRPEAASAVKYQRHDDPFTNPPHNF